MVTDSVLFLTRPHVYRVETVPNLEEAATNKFEAEPHLLWEDSTFNRLHPF